MLHSNERPTRTRRRPVLAVLGPILGVLALAGPARGHFLWVVVEPVPATAAGGAPKAHRALMFLAEHPVPEGPELRKHVEGTALRTRQGVALPLTADDDSLRATWLGDLPDQLDAERDLGLRTRDGQTFRLRYTARAQSTPVPAATAEAGTGLRVRLVGPPGAAALHVSFAGQAAPDARVRVYPETGEPYEIRTDAQGVVRFADPAQARAVETGGVAVFAHWADGQAGLTADGRPFGETRHYATWTYRPRATTPADTHFATMPAPAVNSFGGAVLGDWLYVYSGHVGTTHQYSTATTTRTFRRLNLKDRQTWEDLPLERDLQGVALVSDGRFLYRTGGMCATNAPGTPADLRSVCDAARFDPETRTWTALPPLPEPRSTHDAAVVGRTLYVVGGWKLDGPASGSDFHDTMLTLDLDHPEQGWRSVPQPFERRALAVAEHEGRLYVLGGLTSAGAVVRTVDVFDPATGRWSQGPELPSGAKAEGFGTTAFGVGGRLYSSSVTGPVYRLARDAGRWEAVGQWHVPRITHRILPGPAGALLAVGGNAGSAQTPVIESLPVADLTD